MPIAVAAHPGEDEAARPRPASKLEIVRREGFHYANPVLAADDRLKIRRPEILLYERQGEHLRLRAVEPARRVSVVSVPGR